MTMLKLVKNNDRLDIAIARLNTAAKSARRENDREDARVILKALSRIKNNDSNVDQPGGGKSDG